MRLRVQLRPAGAGIVPAVGAGGVPCPVPIVSPGVPVLMAPVAMPGPGLERLSLLELALDGFDVAGETAASPVVVVEPVLAFWASETEVAKVAATATAMMASFILSFSG